MVTHMQLLKPMALETEQERWSSASGRDPSTNLPSEHASSEAAALEDAIEHSHDCIAVVDLQGNVLFMNLPGVWLLGLDADPMQQRVAWTELWANECIDLVEYSIESVRSGRACRFTAHRSTSRGSSRWWDVAVSPIFDGRGAPVQMFCISRDITEMKATEGTLRRALAAKEMLLQEVNHRVKNSLAAVAGVLSLQARHSSDPNVHACLQQAEARIIAVAAIHRRLYELAGHDRLDIGKCIDEVARDTIATQDAGVKVALRTECEQGITLKSDQAITLALLTAELITNCTKHAFETQGGNVSVEFGALSSQLLLRVDDDGRGLPDDFDPVNSSGLGMKIVLSLIKQLNGQLSIERRAPGAHFRILFPRLAEAPLL